MAIFLALVASLVAVIGLLLLSNATSGVGMIAFACFLGILARLAQAQAHQQRASPPEPAPAWKSTEPDLSKPSTPMTSTEKAVFFVGLVIALCVVGFKLYWDSIGH